MTDERHHVIEIRSFQGIPTAILETWIDATMHLRGSVASAVAGVIAGTNTEAEATRRASSEYVLQGRMEGAALVWHRMSGERGDSDAELAKVAIAYAKTYRPGFRPI